MIDRSNWRHAKTKYPMKLILTILNFQGQFKGQRYTGTSYWLNFDGHFECHFWREKVTTCFSLFPDSAYIEGPICKYLVLLSRSIHWIWDTKKSKLIQLGVPVDLELMLNKSKLSKSNLWGILSWQALQFDVLIDKIGRPSCWPSILSPSKSYKGTSCWNKMSQRSRSSDLVDWSKNVDKVFFRWTFFQGHCETK